MAINPESQYPGKIAPSTAAYPYGQARNITVPGDGTGTPWEAALVNDLFGFQQALLSDTGIVPSGTPDSATVSQYMRAGLKFFGASCTTYAAMKAIKQDRVSDGVGVYTAFRSVIGDNGGGLFVFSSANLSAQVTADTLEGIYVAPDFDGTGASGAWVRMYVGARHIDWYGLAADGTDETAALQEVVSAGGKLEGTRGKLYYVTSSISVPSNSYLYGGWGIEADGFHTGFNLDGVSNVQIKDLDVQPVAGQKGFDFGFLIQNGCSAIHIYENRITDIGSDPASGGTEAGHGIILASSGPINTDIHIYRNRISNVGGKGNLRGDFVYLSYVDEVWVTENVCEQSQRMGVAVTDYCTNFHINRNQIKKPGLAGVDLEPNTGGYVSHSGEIIGNTITDYGSQGAGAIGVQKFAVDFHGPVEDVTFAFNECDAGLNGIQHVNAQNGARDFRVIDNTFKGVVSGDACKMFAGSGTSNWSISRNKFGTAASPLTGQVVNAFDCQNISMTENTCYGDGTAICFFASNCSGVKILNQKLVDDFTKLAEIRNSVSGVGFQVVGNTTSNINTYGVHIRPSSSAVMTGVAIRDNELDGSTGTNALFLEPLTGGSVSEFIWDGNALTGTWAANCNSNVTSTGHFKYYTSTAAVGSPFAGQIIYSFADNKTKQYDGSVWV